MKEKQVKSVKDIHIRMTQEEYMAIKLEAMKRGLTMTYFLIACANEIIKQNEQYSK